MPLSSPANPDSEERAKLAVDQVSWLGQQEVLCLEHLNERNCSVTPRLIPDIVVKQPDDMWIPGGYLMFVVMEKVPGEDLTDHWERPLAERQKIQAAFKEALTYVLLISRVFLSRLMYAGRKLKPSLPVCITVRSTTWA